MYRGAGTFRYDPPDAIERQQLERFFGAAPLERRLDGVVLLFADSTLGELDRRLTFASGTVPVHAREAAREAVRYLSGHDRKTRSVRSEVAKTLLERDSNGLFYAHLDPAAGPALAFEIDPYSIESVKLWRRREDSRSGLFDRNLRRWPMRRLVPNCRVYPRFVVLRVGGVPGREPRRYYELGPLFAS